MERWGKIFQVCPVYLCISRPSHSHSSHHILFPSLAFAFKPEGVAFRSNNPVTVPARDDTDNNGPGKDKDRMILHKEEDAVEEKTS